MLQAVEISKSFGAVKALQDASLNLESGEILALLGANGSGKSTLVKILGGLVKKDKGNISIRDIPIEISSPEVSLNNKIAVAYQDLSLIPHLSVSDNILLGNEPVKKSGIVNRRKAVDMAMEYLSMLQADTDPDRLVLELDSTTQSLVEIAKALSREPEFLLLDEVTAAMHEAHVRNLFDLLQTLKGRGMGILFVSHRMHEVFDLCDRATILRGGESIASVATSDVDESDLVFYMTGMRVEKMAERHRAAFSKDQECILEVNGLAYPPKVDSVSMKAYPGEIVGIGGLQGQGQTEFIRALYGAIPRAEGDIIVAGKTQNYKVPAAAVKDGFGFIPGDREREGIFSVRSVKDNLFMGYYSKTSLRKFINPRTVLDGARAMIQKLKIITGGPNHPASSLSGGNQQKLVVGRWLHVKPKILLLDDPTKGVDVTSRQEIHELLQDMAQEGTTIIIASSDNDELLKISDRILVFYEGTIAEELSGDHLKEEYLITAMLGVGKREEYTINVVE